MTPKIKRDKYCPRCKEELKNEFIDSLYQLDRQEMIKIIIGFKTALDNYENN